MNSLKVAQWEIKKTFFSPAFLVTTLLIPAFIVLAAFVPTLISQTNISARDIGVIDSAGVYTELEQALQGTNYYLEQYDAESLPDLQQQVAEGNLDAIMVIPEELLQSGTVDVYSEDLNNTPEPIIDALNDITSGRRAAKAGLSPQDAAAITSPIIVIPYQAGGEEISIAGLLMPLFLAIILIISVMFSGQVLMQGVIKEKQNRIAEILLSSVTAEELLAGKILGFGALGLIQIGIWLGAGLPAASRFIDLSTLSLNAYDWIIFTFYFLLGYLLLSAMFAAIGATIQDPQSGGQLQGLVMFIPMLPLMFSGAVITDPKAAWVMAVSYIPPMTPAMMLLRSSLTNIPAWETWSTLAILAVSVYITVKLAGRIFKGSLLRTDRNLSLKEIIHTARRPQ